MEVTADFWCRSLAGRGHESGEEEQSGVAPLQRENEGNESCLTCLLLATVWQRRKDRWCERITCPRGRPLTAVKCQGARAGATLGTNSRREGCRHTKAGRQGWGLVAALSASVFSV